MVRLALALVAVSFPLFAPVVAADASAPGCVTVAMANMGDRLQVYPMLGDSIGVSMQTNLPSPGFGLAAFLTPSSCGFQTTLPSNSEFAFPLLP